MKPTWPNIFRIGSYLIGLALLSCGQMALATEPSPEKVQQVRAAIEKLPEKTREQLLRLLQLQEAELELKKAENALDQITRELTDLEKLYEQDAVTGQEVRKARLDMENRKQDLESAKLQLQKTRLKFVEDAIHLTVISARKTVEESGDRRVHITLKNNSDLKEAMTGQPAGVRPKDILPFLNVENLFVHLEQGGVVVGSPYETLVKTLKSGQTISLTFDLKKDVDQLSVVMSYHGQEDVRDVYLQRSQVGGAKVRLKSSQFSQTAGTGAAARYKFTLERLEEGELVLALDTTSLPEGFKVRFLDETGNPLTQVRMLRNVASLTLTAEVNVPESLKPEELDQKLGFFIIAATQEQFELFAQQKNEREMTPGALTALGLAYERMELTPKGVGDINLVFDSLDIARMDAQPFSREGKLVNTGTGVLNDVKLIFDKPGGWEIVSEPARLSGIAPGGEVKFQLKVSPGQDSGVGTYDLKIKARSEQEGVTVESSQKTLKVIIEGQTNTKAMSILAGMAVLLVVGIMIYTIRLSKK